MDMPKISTQNDNASKTRNPGKRRKRLHFAKNSECDETWHKPHKHECKVISITNASIPSAKQ